jgi:hypothetical protein
MFIEDKITFMSEMHPTCQRLYAAALESKSTKGQSAVARLMNVSPQVMRNWESRGVSEKGALIAQGVFGCDANWILFGGSDTTNLMALKPTPIQTHQANEPRPLYGPAEAWPFKSFDKDDWAMLDRESRTLIENYARGLVDRAAMLQRKAS